MNQDVSMRTIKARRVNHARQEAAKHYTVTRVEHSADGTRCFGFAVSDDGTEEIYLSSLVIKKEQMTAADVGAGFRCLIRKHNGYAADGNHPHALLPIQWDGEAEEIEVAGNVADDPLPTIDQEEFDRLANRTGELMDNVVGPMEQMCQDYDKMLQAMGRMFANAKQMRDEIETYKKFLDEIAPENED